MTAAVAFRKNKGRILNDSLEIALSSPLPKIDKYETNLEIYNQLIKKKEELNE